MFSQSRSKSLGGAAAVLLCALATTCAGKAHCQQLIKPEDQQVSVRGIIRLVHDFGPPGYGEDPKHDARVTYWALEAPIPINTPCTPSSPQDAKYECRPAKRMKLFFNGLELKKLNELPAAKWKDRQVVIAGKLHRADTVGEMTPIYIDVTSISASSEASTH
jgi:hypothetical protein